MSAADRAHLLERLRKLGAQLDLRPSAPADPAADDQAWQMHYLSTALERARALTATLAQAERPARWDDVDHVTARIALREVTAAVVLLRRLQKSLAADLDRVETIVRPMAKAVDTAERKLLTDLLKGAVRETRRGGGE